MSSIAGSPQITDSFYRRSDPYSASMLSRQDNDMMYDVDGGNNFHIPQFGATRGDQTTKQSHSFIQQDGEEYQDLASAGHQKGPNKATILKSLNSNLIYGATEYQIEQRRMKMAQNQNNFRLLAPDQKRSALPSELESYAPNSRGTSENEFIQYSASKSQLSQGGKFNIEASPNSQFGVVGHAKRSHQLMKSPKNMKRSFNYYDQTSENDND